MSLVRTTEATSRPSGTEDWPLLTTRARAILATACSFTASRVRLLDKAGRLQLSLDGAWEACAEHDWHGVDTRIARAPVLIGDRVEATVEIEGPASEQAALSALASATAARLADAWMAAVELDSLASELLRAYEELHLLYELGDALTGNLTVKQVAQVILDHLLKAVPVAWGEVRLSDSDERIGSQGANAEASLLPSMDGVHHLSASLRAGGHLVGSIVLARPGADGPFSSAEAKLLDAVGTFAASVIRNAQLRQQVSTDALTGLANHRAIQVRLDEELAKAGQADYPLGLMMVDIDDFKLFNDTYGHLVGDQILRHVGDILTTCCRGTDIIGRYGGDEFIVLLPEAAHGDVRAVAERVLAAIDERSWRPTGQHDLCIGLSIGYATFPHDGLLRHDLLNHADAALYETKRAGGHGARCFSEPATSAMLSVSASSAFEALQGLVAAVDAKDRYTGEHSTMVAEAAVTLAARLGLSSTAQRALYIAGLLHDVGKIGIPDRILRKPGPLTREETAIMERHVSLSELIIRDVPELTHVLDAVACHHERYDGRGYPRGLRGEAIPLLGRIMALADAYAAMLVNRPYRRALDWTEAVAELQRGKGSQFDPELVEPFIRAIREVHEERLALETETGDWREIRPPRAPDSATRALQTPA